jgi:hypothetical protein
MEKFLQKANLNLVRYVVHILEILVHYLRTFSIDLSKNHDVSEEFERSYGWRVFGKDSGGWISYIKKSRNKRKGLLLVEMKRRKMDGRWK